MFKNTAKEAKCFIFLNAILFSYLNYNKNPISFYFVSIIKWIHKYSWELRNKFHDGIHAKSNQNLLLFLFFKIFFILRITQHIIFMVKICSILSVKISENVKNVSY